ncbi:MAG: hypothetical protein IH945_02130 [Armatimonadetes bacterium]|nr:hypothetical protein [Armatimonadota bacterium]
MEKSDRDPKPLYLRLPAAIADSLNRMAFWERRTLVDVVAEAISQYVKKHERTKGKYREIPEGQSVKRGRPSAKRRPQA